MNERAVDQPQDHAAVFWVTGFTDSGKSTFARMLTSDLRALGVPTILLETDAIRRILGRRYGFMRKDRLVVSRFYAKLCRLLNDQEFTVVCATGSMFDEVRRWNRENIKRYKEIYIRAPAEAIIERHPTGLFARAIAGGVRNIPGVDQIAEEPRFPDLLVDNDLSTTREDLKSIASAFVNEWRASIT